VTLLQGNEGGDVMASDDTRPAGKRTAGAFVGSDDDCLRWLWTEFHAANGVHAPCGHCGQVRKFHRVKGRRAFACDHCGAQVYPTSGTFLERSNIELSKWFSAVALILESDGRTPAKRLAGELAVSYRTALRMRERILGASQAGSRQAELVMRIHDRVEASANPLAARLRANARQSHADLVVDTIRAAACKTFAQHGLGEARIKDIALEAGVSSATVHYYFKSKEQVLLAALEWSNEQWDAKALQIRQETPNPIEALRRYLLWCLPLDGVARDYYRLWLETWVATGRHPELVRACAAISAEFESFIQSIVEAGTKTGVFAPVASASEIAERIATMITGLSLKSAVGYERWAPEHASQVLFRFVAEQLGFPPSALGVFSP
jgi:AcrR family transcriptional regulator/transposase-like protein